MRSKNNLLSTKAKTAALLLLCCFATLPSAVNAQKSEADILALFYDQANGQSWTNKWNITDKTVCNSKSYPGVTCNDSNKITEIDLHENKLEGKVTPWIYALTELTKLELSNNEIDSGGWDQIDDVKGAKLGFALGTKLESIILSNNKISSLEGIDSLGNTLQELHLTYNRIAGSMPNELFSLNKLKILSISENEITGKIDTRLGTLTDLTELYCYGNKLKGHIPQEIGLLTKLQTLTVSIDNFVWVQLNELIMGRPPPPKHF